MDDKRDRPGRWRTGDESRRRILTAARHTFGQHGYDRTTIRAIAAAASVDPAMVHYFFDTKARLFAEVMELPSGVPERLSAQLEGDTDGLGERIVRHFLLAWDDEATVGPLLALMRSAPSDDRSASMLIEFMKREIVERLGRTLEGPDAELRAELVASQLIGLALMRYVVRLEPLASTPAEQIAPRMGAALQQYISPA